MNHECGLRFEPCVLYTLEEIEQRLNGVMSVKTFLDNLGLGTTGRTRMFEKAVWGDEIIKALERVGDRPAEPIAKPQLGAKRRLPSRGALDKIDASEVLDIGGKRA